jgi:hypothetical protein
LEDKSAAGQLLHCMQMVDYAKTGFNRCNLSSPQISVMQSFEDSETAFAFQVIAFYSGHHLPSAACAPTCVDTQHATSSQMLQMVKLQLSPDVIYLPSTADAELVQQCEIGLADDAEPIQLVTERVSTFHHDKVVGSACSVVTCEY